MFTAELSKVLRMIKARLLLSVLNDDNDFQIEQVKSAHQAAARVGADLDIVYAQDDAINQSQQLLNRIQSAAETRPNVIIFEPAGSTTLPHVARAAAEAGIGWVVLSRDAEYIGELRSVFHIPAFVVSADQEEIGRIQGRQLAALLPRGGIVFTIQGPSQSKAAELRHVGLLATKPENVHLRLVRAHWTEASAQRIVRSWLTLSTSRGTDIAAVCAQDDSMAMGRLYIFFILIFIINSFSFIRIVLLFYPFRVCFAVLNCIYPFYLC
jgi:ribose transport system substrate-binding protein